MTEDEIKLYEKLRYVTDETDKDEPVAILSFDLVNDKLCHFLTFLTFLFHHFFETVERSQKKKKNHWSIFQSQYSKRNMNTQHLF